MIKLKMSLGGSRVEASILITNRTVSICDTNQRKVFSFIKKILLKRKEFIQKSRLHNISFLSLKGFVFYFYLKC